MKKLLLLAAAFVFTFSACKKKESTILPSPETDTVYVKPAIRTDSSIAIDGIKEIRTTSWDEYTLPLTIQRIHGLERRVSMSVSGLPEHVKAEFSSTSGYTTFNTNLLLNIMFVTPGTYPLTITGSTDQGKMDYTVNFVVDSLTTDECNTKFINQISGAPRTWELALDSVIPANTGINYDPLKKELSVFFLALSYDDDFSKYYMTSFSSQPGRVRLTVNCDNGTLEIPAQTVEGYSISGSSSKTFTISGNGHIDIEKGIYTITYTTQHIDGGNTVTKHFRLEGPM